MSHGAVILAPGRDAPIRERHPWISSDAIARTEGDPAVGDEVEVRAAGGEVIARGLFAPGTGIPVRCYAWNRFQRVDGALLTVRIGAAVALRERLGLMDPLGACRVVAAEADGLSGLVVDRWADQATVRFTSAALWIHRETIVAALRIHLKPRAMVVTAEPDVVDASAPTDGPLLVDGALPEVCVEFKENGFWYSVDLRAHPRDRHALDQRDNRARAEPYANGRRVAEVCCTRGGFTLPLLRGGATSVECVDASEGALELLRTNLHRNGFGDAPVTATRTAEAEWMRAAFDGGQRFEMLVLDPPSFDGAEDPGARHAEWNEHAVRLLEPNGVLVTHSRSTRVRRDAFLATLARVETRTGRRIRVLEVHGQPADHPVSPTTPESEALTCLICTVD